MCPSYHWPLCSFERTWTPSCCSLSGYAYCVLIMGAGSLCFWQTLLQGGNDPSVSKVGKTHACLVTPLAAVFPEAGVWSLGYLSRSQVLPWASTQVSFPFHTIHYMCYVGIPIDHCPMSHILLGPIYCSRGLGSHCPHDWHHKAYQTQTGRSTSSSPDTLTNHLPWFLIWLWVTAGSDMTWMTATKITGPLNTRGHFCFDHIDTFPFWVIVQQYQVIVWLLLSSNWMLFELTFEV